LAYVLTRFAGVVLDVKEVAVAVNAEVVAKVHAEGVEAGQDVEGRTQYVEGGAQDAEDVVGIDLGVNGVRDGG